MSTEEWNHSLDHLSLRKSVAIFLYEKKVELNRLRTVFTNNAIKQKQNNSFGKHVGIH